MTEVAISPEVWDRLSLVVRFVETMMTSEKPADEKYRAISRSLVFVRVDSDIPIAPYRWAGKYFERTDVHDRSLVPVWENVEGFDCDVLTLDNAPPEIGLMYAAVTIGQEVETSNPVVMLIGIAEEDVSSGSRNMIGPFVTKSWTVCEVDDYGNNTLVSYNERSIQYVDESGNPGNVVYYDTVTV